MTNKLLILSAALVACSSTVTPVTTDTDSGTPGADTSVPSGDFAFSGTTINFSTMAPVGGTTVTAGSIMGTADKSGDYSLAIPMGTPAFSPTYSADTYVTLIDQEITLSGSAARTGAASTNMVPLMTEQLLTGGILTNPAFDGTLGSFSFSLSKTGSCASVDGATVELSPKGSEALVYFAGGLPSTGQKSVSGAEAVSGLFYNITVGQKIVLNITPGGASAGCTAVAFPVADETLPTITYTGNVNVVASIDGNNATVSYARYFMK